MQHHRSSNVNQELDDIFKSILGMFHAWMLSHKHFSVGGIGYDNNNVSTSINILKFKKSSPTSYILRKGYVWKPIYVKEKLFSFVQADRCIYLNFQTFLNILNWKNKCVNASNKNFRFLLNEPSYDYVFICLLNSLVFKF